MKMVKEYRWYIGFLIALVVFVLLSGFNGLYGQDSYEYLRFTKALVLFYKSGISPGGFFWPLLYPITGSVLSFVFGATFSLQLISIFSLVGSAVFLEKINRLLYPEKAGQGKVYVFLAFMLSPYILRASLVVMSDMLCVFMITGAWYCLFKYRSLPSNKYLIWFSAFAVAAITTRYAAIVVLFIPLVVVAYHIINDRRWKVAAISIIVWAIVILPYYLLHRHLPFAFIKNDWLTTWSFANFFRSDFITDGGGIAHYNTWNVIYVFYNLAHPAFCFAGILFTVLSLKYLKKMRAEVIFTMASIVLYALFLAGIPFQNLRFLILSFPLVVVLLYPAFIRIINYLCEGRGMGKMKVNAIYLIAAVIQIALFCRVLMPFYHDSKIEKQLTAVILQYPGLPLYTFSVDGALKAYGVSNTIINLYDVKLDTLKQAPGEKLVLFNEKQWAEPWRGKNPMLNWNYIKHTFTLTKVKDLPDGWQLYTAFDKIN